MAYLEYRIIDKKETYPVLTYYENINKDEIALRFTCDYFVQNGIVYEQVSKCKEQNENGTAYVAYVKLADEEQPLQYTTKNNGFFSSIRIELRHFKGENQTNHPLINFIEFHDDDDALIHLSSNLFYAEGKEWIKTSCEIDEDRETYVVYVEENA